MLMIHLNIFLESILIKPVFLFFYLHAFKNNDKSLNLIVHLFLNFR